MSSRYVLETKPNLFEEHCARTTHSMESCDMKTRWYCLFCDQWDRSKGREKDQYLIYPGHYRIVAVTPVRMGRYALSYNTASISFNKFIYTRLKLDEYIPSYCLLYFSYTRKIVLHIHQKDNSVKLQI